MSPHHDHVSLWVPSFTQTQRVTPLHPENEGMEPENDGFQVWNLFQGASIFRF